MESDFNPMSFEYHQRRFEHYPSLLASSPLYYSEPAGGWVVSRYEDVSQVLTRHEIYSSSPQQGEGFGFATGVGPDASPEDMRRMQTLLSALPFGMDELANANMLVSEDPPRHTVMRRVFSAAFRPGTIAALETTIRSIVSPCIEDMRTAREFDLLDGFATRVPLQTIVTMLGADAGRVTEFKAWADELLSAAGGVERKTDAAEERFGKVVIDICAYVKPLIDERRAHPGDDLISLVIKGQDSDARVTDFEVVLFVILLLIAGSETTTNLIANTVHELLQDDRQLQLLIDNPALIANAIEETLRCRSPVQQIFRKTTRATELSGTRLPKDALVILLLGATGFDPDVWQDPARYDVAREVRRNLGFGSGAHACLGMNLGRLEARAALEAVIPELPKWKLARRDNPLIDSFMVWGYQSMPLQRR